MTCPCCRWRNLFYFARTLLAVALPGQRLFLAALFTGFQIERMTFDFFNDVFLLHFPLKAAQSAFERFPILQMDFCQTDSPPSGLIL